MPLALGDATGAAVAELSSVRFEQDGEKFDAIVAVKYGWPLDQGDGYGCCPFAAQIDKVAECIPGSCPIITAGQYAPSGEPSLRRDHARRCVRVRRASALRCVSV